MGVARVKLAILRVLLISNTPLCRLRRDAADVRLDELGPHIDAVSRIDCI